jgi:phosphoribosylformylglycinamidine cyclo-ligase
VLAIREALVGEGRDIHGAAHVTGGGLPGNVPRALPEGLVARVDPRRWSMPSVMHLFGALGGLEDDELRATFNGGLGIVLVVPPAAIPTAIRVASDRGTPATVVGEVAEGSPGEPPTYVEGELESVA